MQTELNNWTYIYQNKNQQSAINTMTHKEFWQSTLIL